MPISFKTSADSAASLTCTIPGFTTMEANLRQQHGPLLFYLESIGRLPSGGTGQAFEWKYRSRFLDEDATAALEGMTHVIELGDAKDGIAAGRYISIEGVQYLLDNSTKLNDDAALRYRVSLGFWHALAMHVPENEARHSTAQGSVAKGPSHAQAREIAGSQSTEIAGRTGVVGVQAWRRGYQPLDGQALGSTLQG